MPAQEDIAMSGWTKIKWDDAMLAAARRGLVKAGIIIEGQAVRLVPVDTGRLKGSITYATQSVRSNPSGEAGADDGVSSPTDDYTLHVGTNVEYAPYVEYGTRRMAAQSYLRAALDIQRVNVDMAYAQEISKELQRRGQ
jgi:HK97 gp10 family phage protein